MVVGGGGGEGEGGGRALDLRLKSHGFESQQELRGKFSFPGPTFCADSYFSICA